jgi:hypothetical protein
MAVEPHDPAVRTQARAKAERVELPSLTVGLVVAGFILVAWSWPASFW